MGMKDVFVHYKKMFGFKNLSIMNQNPKSINKKFNLFKVYKFYLFSQEVQCLNIKNIKYGKLFLLYHIGVQRLNLN